jgi:hypothetical protein
MSDETPTISSVSVTEATFKPTPVGTTMWTHNGTTYAWTPEPGMTAYELARYQQMELVAQNGWVDWIGWVRKHNLVRLFVPTVPRED